MWKTEEGSTGRLLQLCVAYFFFYVVTGVALKYFQGSPKDGFPGMADIEFATYSTIGGNLLCLIAVLLFGWYRLQSNQMTKLWGLTFPREFYYIIPSGVCTAIIIPTTTLMYSLDMSVMVAMVIMRGGVIIISRLVDEVQLRQGILKKRVYAVENIAVVFALLAAGTAILVNVVYPEESSKSGPRPDAIPMSVGMIILASYLGAYAIRIYIMNYFKNTRAKGVKLDNQGFFGVEQIAATVTILLVGLVIYFGADSFGWSEVPQIVNFKESFTAPKESWWFWAILAGTPFGAVAFFSVFIFMFKGRSATFAGLVNRLTSLIAGTAATLIFALFFNPNKYPKLADWVALGFILIAVYFLTIAEKKRALEAASNQAAPSAPSRAA